MAIEEHGSWKAYEVLRCEIRVHQIIPQCKKFTEWEHSKQKRSSIELTFVEMHENVCSKTLGLPRVFLLYLEPILFTVYRVHFKKYPCFLSLLKYTHFHLLIKDLLYWLHIYNYAIQHIGIMLIILKVLYY